MKQIELENIIKKAVIDVFSNNDFSKFFIGNMIKEVLRDESVVEKFNKPIKNLIQELMFDECKNKGKISESEEDEMEDFLEGFRPKK